MPLDPEFVADCPYSPEGLLIDDVVSVDKERGERGTITQPDYNGVPKGKDLCPAGDSCQNPGAYTYSDFTGFGARYLSSGATRGQYTVIVRSHCLDVPGATGTRWRSLDWDASIPTGARLVFNVRQGPTPLPDATWTSAAGNFTLTPDDLSTVAPQPWPYLQILVDFSAPSLAKSPRLRSMTVYSECLP